ncbi:MAG: T9SS type A sorting domain-containing protein [Chitinophagales bacterium]|nr:T9SS type A sorting domain-containing protein [Chitinophagales bacterium]MDW8393449.1 T9SS type A sorting domain-containing protein [Chitinophagales bacterium]
MKKLLLAVSCLVVAGAVLAQAPNTVPMKMPLPDFAQKYGLKDPERTVPLNTDRIYWSHPKGSIATAGTRTVDRVPIGSSFNAYTLLVSEQQCLVARPELNMVGFVHRINVSKSTNSGDIVMTYSTDGGMTWDSTNKWTLAYKNSTYPRGRYPQGGIFNPAGNTDPLGTYAVVSGPITDGSAWVANYLSSAKTGNTDISGVSANIHLDGAYDMARLDFHTATNNVYAIGAQYDFDASGGPFGGAFVMKGTWNANTNSFSYQIIDVDYSVFDDGVNGELFYTLGNQAWSPDGQIGYVMVIGCDNDQVAQGNYPIWPILMKTTDGGNSWTKVNADFSSIPAWEEYLFASTDGSYRPFFLPSNAVDMFLDKDNRLHIVCQVISQYTNHPDSVLFYLVDANTGTYPQHIFDVYETATGWDAQYLTTIQASPVTTSVTPYADQLTWDARINVALSPDRDTYFLMWMDTRPDFETYNLYPDIWGKGWRTSAGKGDTTARRNFTEGTSLDANNYWMFVGNYALYDGSKYKVPVTTSFSTSGQFDGVTSHTHYYVQGIEFSDTDFPIGISEVVAAPMKAEVYPNPVNGAYEVKFNTTSAQVDVTISSVSGQVVQKLNDVSVSGNRIRLHSGNLTNGVYVVQVIDGNTVHTCNLVVASK